MGVSFCFFFSIHSSFSRLLLLDYFLFEYIHSHVWVGLGCKYMAWVGMGDIHGLGTCGFDYFLGVIIWHDTASYDMLRNNFLHSFCIGSCVWYYSSPMWGFLRSRQKKSWVPLTLKYQGNRHLTAHTTIYFSSNPSTSFNPLSKSSCKSLQSSHPTLTLNNLSSALASVIALHSIKLSTVPSDVA